MIMMIIIKLENTPTFRAHISYKLLIILSEYLIVFVFMCCKYVLNMGHAVTQLVASPHYKPEDRGFDPRWYHWHFSLT